MKTETETIWSFDPFDTLFFRESRPHGALGGSELGSLFPPPARTLAGAIRFAMGESVGVDWQAFGRGKGQVGGLNLNAEIGLGDDMGKLRLGGPWLARWLSEDRWERLFPAPRLLLALTKPGDKESGHDARHRKILRTAVGPWVDSDLGRVRLPSLPREVDVRPRSLDKTWLTHSGFAKVLQGGIPAASELVELGEHLRGEARLGIARNKQLRTPIEGLLYQTRHVRLPGDLRIEVDLEGVVPRLLVPLPVVRLGGEGRVAAIRRVEEVRGFPAPPMPDPDTYGLVLCLLTPADLNGAWLPGKPIEPDLPEGNLTWARRIEGVDLEIHCAILGKPDREGGWDLALRQPRPVRSLVSAGSVWYCTVRRGSLQEAIRRLHGATLGSSESQALGRGKLAVALWNRSENQEGEQT